MFPQPKTITHMLFLAMIITLQFAAEVIYAYVLAHHTSWDLIKLIYIFYLFKNHGHLFLSENGYFFCCCFVFFYWEPDSEEYKMTSTFYSTLWCQSWFVLIWQFYPPSFLHHQCKCQHREKANNVSILF